MNNLTALVLFAVIALAFSATDLHPRGCIYALGHCVRDCEEGTRAYTTGCGYLTPEATCDEPNPKKKTGAKICDYSACYCEPPTVRDPRTKKCVALEECSKEEKSDQ